MNNETPLAGAAGNELAQKAHQWWCEAAEKSGIDVSALHPTAPFEQRVAWALSLPSSELQQHSRKVESGLVVSSTSVNSTFAES